MSRAELRGNEPGLARAAFLAVAAICCAAWPAVAVAGPPFVTDDPEPTPYHCWETYIASQEVRDASGRSGTLPHVEINYGPAPNLQLHIILPYAFDRPAGAGTAHGYGDTELGAKWRFVQETDHRPMVGIFPLVEVPTGSAARGLGAGYWQVFMPVWVQKSWGPWTTDFGGGYWINPGAGNRNYWLFGWLTQKNLSEHLTLGGELYYTTASADDTPSDLLYNLGGQYNFDEGHHFLFSVGRSLRDGPDWTSYFAFQWTYGPR